MICILACFLFYLIFAAKENDEYCYDNCSNHGKCVKNICICEVGWFGENCGTFFGLPPLSIGDVNITNIQQLNDVIKSRETVLIGLSSSQCAKCSYAETEYAKVDFQNILFVRIDINKYPEIFTSLGSGSAPIVPSLILSWNKGKKKDYYRGYSTGKDISTFIKYKSISPGWTKWNSNDIPPFVIRDKMMINRKSNNNKVNDMIEEEEERRYDFIVVGFFYSQDEDEFEEFEQVADELRSRHDIHFFYHQITKKKEISSASRPYWYPSTRLIPAIGLFPNNSTNMEEFKYLSLNDHGNNERLSRWIALGAISEDASKMTTDSFVLAEQLGLPMLLVFFPQQQQQDNLKIIILALHNCAKEFRGKITFLYDLHGEFSTQMRVLGLHDKNKVSMAMNTKNIGPVPFLGEVTSDSIRIFCIEFLAGRTTPLSKLPNRVTEQKIEEEEEKDVPGVKESFKNNEIGIVDVTREWSRIALDESKDVMIFVYRSKGCLPCKQLTPYYKKVAKRFHDVAKTTKHHIVSARLDLDVYIPDSLADIVAPAIIMLPAFSKYPPYPAFSAIAKVFTIMEWARNNAGRKFEWGEELPQFDEEEKKLFKEQIKMREDSREAKNVEL